MSVFLKKRKIHLHYLCFVFSFAYENIYKDHTQDHHCVFGSSFWFLYFRTVIKLRHDNSYSFVCFIWRLFHLIFFRCNNTVYGCIFEILRMPSWSKFSPNTGQDLNTGSNMRHWPKAIGLSPKPVIKIHDKCVPAINHHGLCLSISKAFSVSSPSSVMKNSV